MLRWIFTRIIGFILPNLISNFLKSEKTSEKSSHVFNLACLIVIPYSYKAPKSYIDTNLKGLMNLMDIIKKKIKQC